MIRIEQGLFFSGNYEMGDLQILNLWLEIFTNCTHRFNTVKFESEPWGDFQILLSRKKFTKKKILNLLLFR